VIESRFHILRGSSFPNPAKSSKVNRCQPLKVDNKTSVNLLCHRVLHQNRNFPAGNLATDTKRIDGKRKKVSRRAAELAEFWWEVPASSAALRDTFKKIRVKKVPGTLLHRIPGDAVPHLLRDESMKSDAVEVATHSLLKSIDGDRARGFLAHFYRGPKYPLCKQKMRRPLWGPTERLHPL